MPHIHPTAAAHERLEGLLHCAGPSRSAAEVVAGLDDDVVVGEGRAPPVPTRRARGGWCGGDAHREETRGLEDAPDERGCQAPVVVAVAVNDEHGTGRALVAPADTAALGTRDNAMPARRMRMSTR